MVQRLFKRAKKTKIPTYVGTEIVIEEPELATFIERLKKKDPTLISQKLHKIDTTGVKALTTVLASNTTLKSLQLHVDDEEAKILAPMLARNSTLTELELSNYGFSSTKKICATGALALASALIRNKTLLSLNLYANTIDTAGAQALALALEKNNTLTELNIDENVIGVNGVEAFKNVLTGSAHLAGNTMLTKLEFYSAVVGAHELSSILGKVYSAFEPREYSFCEPSADEKIIYKYIDRNLELKNKRETKITSSLSVVKPTFTMPTVELKPLTAKTILQGEIKLAQQKNQHLLIAEIKKVPATEAQKNVLNPQTLKNQKKAAHLEELAALRKSWHEKPTDEIISAYESWISKEPKESCNYREQGYFYLQFADKTPDKVLKKSNYNKAKASFDKAIECNSFDELAAAGYESAEARLIGQTQSAIPIVVSAAVTVAPAKKLLTLEEIKALKKAEILAKQKLKVNKPKIAVSDLRQEITPTIASSSLKKI